MDNVFLQNDILNLPQRTDKPRKYGITATHDVGIPVGELDFILKDYGHLLDIAKLGVGSAAIIPNLVEKIGIYRKHNICVYFGGTLFEKFYHIGQLKHYISLLKELGIDWIEVSDGTIEISLEERLKVVRELLSEFTVVAEVGCKDAQTIMPPSQWIHEINEFLNAGCAYVITEGRDSGSAGLYRANGEIRTGLIADIVSSVDYKRLIIEAPNCNAQNYFINMLGSNVNLGNISSRDLLILESQRCGLRSDTFFIQ